MAGIHSTYNNIAHNAYRYKISKALYFISTLKLEEVLLPIKHFAQLHSLINSIMYK